MSTPLSSADLAAIGAAQRVLLSPLDFEDTVAWRWAISEVLHPLFQHRGFASLLDAPPEPYMSTDFLDDKALRDYSEYYGKLDSSGMMHLNKQPYATNYTIFEQRGAESMAELLRTEGYNDFYLPNRMVFAVALAAYDEGPGKAHGSAFDGIAGFFGVYYGTWDLPGSESRRRLLLDLLYPAFEAGVGFVRRLLSAQKELVALIDQMDLPLFVFDMDGTLQHQSATLSTLLNCDPERERLVCHATLAAREVILAVRPAARSKAMGEPAHQAVSHIAETRTGRYRVQASIVQAVLAQPLVAVIVDRLAPETAFGAAMQERFGLSHREAEVALLLAERKRTKEIAAALAISHHTVRHHISHVLAKLGVDRRDDVEAVLLAVQNSDSAGAAQR